MARPEKTLTTPGPKSPSRAGKYADELMNYDNGKGACPDPRPYEDAVSGGPESKPGSISKNSSRSQ